MRSFRKRFLAVVLTASLATTLMPPTALLHHGGIVVKAAGSGNPADCKKVSGRTSGKEIVIYEKKDGKASKTGVQKTKFVDKSGKAVDMSNIRNEKYISSGDAIDYIKDSTYVSDGIANSGANTTVSGSIPAKYTSPYMTRAAQNQGGWGVCWTFGATAAMEANVVKKITENAGSFPGLAKNSVDFSERYLAWFAHNTFTTDKTDMAYGDGQKKTTPQKAFVGGNDAMTAALLAMGAGPELESTAPYDTTQNMKGVAEPFRQQAVAKLYDWNTIGDYNSDDTTLRNTIKAMIMNYGATTISYKSVDANYGTDAEGNTNFYYPHGGTNHEISIVGWDDNYSAGNFKQTPPGNGAWYCRNSWGSTWGNGSKKTGYFYLSYYDKSISSISAFDMKSGDSYGKAYYYMRDHWNIGFNGGDGGTGNFNWNATTAANVFKAEGNETLKSVGLLTYTGGCKAEATVYVSDTAMTKPTDGTKAATKNIDDLGLEGFHTIDLNSPVSLKKGQYFSVIIRIIHPTANPIFRAEFKGAGREKKGQTYYYDGWNQAWVDSTAKAHADKCNVAIYAYTNPAEKETATLQALIKQADGLKEADVKASGGEKVWNRIQVEKLLAKNAREAGNIKRSIHMLQSAMSSLNSRNLYKDTYYSDGPGPNGVELYANGGTVKVNGISTNYKTRTLYPSFERTHSWVKKGKFYQGIVSGKYVAAVTTTNKKPELNLNGTVKAPDTAAQAIATASVSGSKVVIRPKAEGDVYVWVLWYPKCSSGFNQQERLDAQTDYAMTKVHISTAPAAVRLYAADSDDPVNSAVNYTSVTMPAGGSTDVYVKGTVGSITRRANTMRVIDNKEIGYNCTVPAKFADYVTVTRDASDPQLFHITTKDTILDALKVKDGKKLTVTLPVVCDKNGRKANFKLIIANPTKSSVLSAGDDTTKLSIDNTKKLASVTLDSAKTAVQTAMIKETTTLYNPDKKGTDGTTIIKIPCEDGFTYTPANGIKVVGKISAAQKKVSLAAVKRQPGMYKITAARGTPGGTEAYFVLLHNAYGRTKGAGFQVIKVKVGEANHVSRTVVEKAADDTVVATGKDKLAAVTMAAGTTKATTAQIRETVTLADATKEGTDGTSIFRMPSADAFAVTTAKEITVTDALSAQQKKISMAAVKGKPGEYKITAAKGIQPGTEVYFMLFHNAESGTSGTGYQIIKVTAGEANHVKQITVKGSNGAAVSTDSKKIVTVTVTASKKAAVTAEIAETVTLQNTAKDGTDISRIYRMPAADGFAITKSKEIQVTGTLTAQQKKVSLTAVKGKTGTYKITAARGVLPGTEVYFMLFHNAVTGASGTGYQIIRVVIQ